MCGKKCWINSYVLALFLALIGCNGTSQNTSKSIPENIDLPQSFNAIGLVYHRFGDNRYPSTNTPLEQIEKQLQYLEQKGFKSYTVSELLTQAKDSAKKVFITVDDGLKSFYTNGWPLFKKYKAKATLFVNTESVGWGDYLSWKQIKELSNTGVEIGSHSHKHTYFLSTPDSIRKSLFIKDLEISEKLFKDSLGYIPRVYAYPYGEFDEMMAEELKGRGYLLAFAQNSGVWSAYSNRYAIPRFPIAGNYVGMEQFKSKVNMTSMAIADELPFPKVLSPGDSYKNKFVIDSIQSFKSINCFFHNKPNSKVSRFEDGSLFVNLKMPANSRRVLLTFTGKDEKGNWCWWSKLFVNPAQTE